MGWASQEAVDDYLSSSLRSVWLEQVLPRRVWYGRWVREPGGHEEQHEAGWEKEVYKRDATREAIADSCLAFFARRCGGVVSLSASGIPILDAGVCGANPLFVQPHLWVLWLGRTTRACGTVRRLGAAGCTQRCVPRCSVGRS